MVSSRLSRERSEDVLISPLSGSPRYLLSPEHGTATSSDKGLERQAVQSKNEQSHLFYLGYPADGESLALTD